MPPKALGELCIHSHAPWTCKLARAQKLSCGSQGKSSADVRLSWPPPLAPRPFPLAHLHLVSPGRVMGIQAGVLVSPFPAPGVGTSPVSPKPLDIQAPGSPHSAGLTLPLNPSGLVTSCLTPAALTRHLASPPASLSSGRAAWRTRSSPSLAQCTTPGLWHSQKLL